MSSKQLQYVVFKKKITFGKHRGKTMQIARLTGRYHVDFERFCELVAYNTTLNYMEVQSVLNLAADTARDLVSEGAIVDYGRLGHLMPSFKSRVVELEEKFNPTIHIEEVKVLLRPSKRYFTLEDIHFRRAPQKTKKTKG